MAGNNIEIVTPDHTTTHGMITEEQIIMTKLLEHTLESWRFLLVIIIPPLLWTIFAAFPSVLRAVIALLSAAGIYGCWRLWLDVGYLAQFNTAPSQQTGAALAEIWQREKLATLTLAERQQGALCQLRRTLWITGILWFLWLLLLVKY